MARNLERNRARASAAFVSWSRADVDTGVLLQRNLFYLCVGLDAFLFCVGK